MCLRKVAANILIRILSRSIRETFCLSAVVHLRAWKKLLLVALVRGLVLALENELRMRSLKT